MSRPSNQLTDRMGRFVSEYLLHNNASRAAAEAGYSLKTARRIGSELLRKPQVKAAIQKALEEQQIRTLVKADENLIAIENLAVKAESVGDLGAAIRARELIGKHYKSFAEKVELTGKDGGPLDVRRSAADLSDDELAAIAARKK